MQQRGHGDQRDRARNDVARLIEVTLVNKVTRLIALATARSGGSGRARDDNFARLSNIALAHARDNDVARLIALATTRSREIVLKTTLSQRSEKSRWQTTLQGSERSRLRRRCCKAYCSCNNKVARIGEIVLATAMGQGLSPHLQ